MYAFEYQRPSSVDAAAAATQGADARYLAGGQSLVQAMKLRLSSAGTRWGSASADGSIRLNWRLIHLSMEMIDYVVVHELSHLRHMDHSPRFWDVVASVMPDHAERRAALKRAAVPLE